MGGSTFNNGENNQKVYACSYFSILKRTQYVKYELWNLLLSQNVVWAAILNSLEKHYVVVNWLIVYSHLH